MVDTAGPQRSSTPLGAPLNYQAAQRPVSQQPPIASPASPPRQPLVAPQAPIAQQPMTPQQPITPQQPVMSQPAAPIAQQPGMIRTPDPRPMIPQQPATPGAGADQHPGTPGYGSVPAYRQTSEAAPLQHEANRFGSGDPIDPEFGLPPSPTNGHPWPAVMNEPPFDPPGSAPVIGDESGAGQWPLMVGEPKARSRSGLKVLLFLFLAIVLAAGGYFAYVIKIRPALEARNPAAKQPAAPASQAAGQQAAKPPAAGGSPAASVQTPAKQDNTAAAPAADAKNGNGPASPSTAKPGAAATQAPVASAPPSAVDNLPAGAKLITLQAASFPNEGAAKGFCDKLVAAGVPAYVVAADVPKRGKWFRVRIGRFATAEEAKASSSAWHQRAQAARIDLKLIQCDYQKP